MYVVPFDMKLTLWICFNNNNNIKNPPLYQALGRQIIAYSTARKTSHVVV